MRRRRAAPNADAPGQDSFMDVVTNLVGILIILVMVVAVRAKDAMLDAGTGATPATEEPAPDLRSAQEVARSVESDIHQLSTTLGRQDLEIAYRREERNRVQLLVGAIEEEINHRRSQLDASQQQRFDAQQSLIVARSELEQLQRGRDALENAPPSVEVIEHLPTPMAKTVFGKEIHFRLGDGRLTYVPWDELVEQLKREAPHKVWRLKDEPQFTETLGPIGGFWMKYTLKRTEQTIPTRMGPAVQTRVELDRFILTPVTVDLGEPLDQALQPGSEFLTRLEQHRPDETTVTVWVYPDCYGSFRKFKKILFDRGYLTAGRPLPADHPIGGSPQGTRSAAE